MTDILDLRQASARQMRPLLEFEARLWETLLQWDYRSSTELLLGYLQNRVLPGYVALHAGEPEGFAFSVFEAEKAVIGDCFSRPAFARAPGDEGRDPTLHRLLTHLLELLRATPGVDRIEAQLLLYPAGTLAPVFLDHGFSLFPRLFMECDLTQPAPAISPAPLPPSLRLRRWSPGDFDNAAELIHHAYQGHVDARINDQYRSLHGSLRFLHNIVRFPGCGTFEAQHSWMLEHLPPDGPTGNHAGRLAGMLLCSRIASEVGHITQLCLAPGLRNRGLGAALLANGLHELRRAGYRAVSLTVTEENHRAIAVYTAAGFRTLRRFDAAALDLASHRQPKS